MSRSLAVLLAVGMMLGTSAGLAQTGTQAVPRGTFPEGLSIPVTPEQAALEVMATDLLNRLSSLGFSEYRRFERVGDVYFIDVVTGYLEEITLRVDLLANEITRVD